MIELPEPTITWDETIPRIDVVNANLLEMNEETRLPYLAGLSRLRMPRRSLAVVTGLLAFGCLALRIAYATKPVVIVVHVNHIEVTGPVVIFHFAMLTDTLGISTLLLLAGVAVGRIATRGGSRHVFNP